MELITGKKFEALAGGNIHYVKIDNVDAFFLHARPHQPYVLITHNGDLPVGGRHLGNLSDPNLIRWYAQNVDYSHPKLTSIPIGIPNPQWIREEIYWEAATMAIERSNPIFFNSFAKDNNMKERTVCASMLSKFGLKMSERIGIVELMHEYKKAFFVPAPNGNGIDTHRLWECLYMGAIPIVTRSVNTEFYKDLPIYFLDKWEDFDASVFTAELYHKMWSSCKSFDQMNFNYWKNTIHLTAQSV